MAAQSTVKLTHPKTNLTAIVHCSDGSLRHFRLLLNRPVEETDRALIWGYFALQVGGEPHRIMLLENGLIRPRVIAELDCA